MQERAVLRRIERCLFDGFRLEAVIQEEAEGALCQLVQPGCRQRHFPAEDALRPHLGNQKLPGQRSGFCGHDGVFQFRDLMRRIADQVLKGGLALLLRQEI